MAAPCGLPRPGIGAKAGQTDRAALLLRKRTIFPCLPWGWQPLLRERGGLLIDDLRLLIARWLALPRRIGSKSSIFDHQSAISSASLR